MVVISEGLSDWSQGHGSLLYAGRGAQGLLSEPLTAFFSSRRCPGAAIRAAMDWALDQARNRQPVVSGFHLALEQSVLTVLLQARCPVVAVLARPVAGARLAPERAEPLTQGRMAVVSAVVNAGRLTEERAAARNQLVAGVASEIVVAHANPGGRLAGLCDEWRAGGRVIRWLG